MSSSRVFLTTSLAEDYTTEQRIRTRIILHIFLRVLGIMSMCSGVGSLWFTRIASTIYRKHHIGMKWFYEFADNGFLMIGIYCVILFPSIDLIWPSKETKKEKYTSLICMLLISIPLVVLFMLFVTVDLADTGFDVTSINIACIDRPSGCKCLRNAKAFGKDLLVHNTSESKDSPDVDEIYILSQFKTCKDYNLFLNAVIISLILIYATLFLEIGELLITIVFLRYVLSKESLSQRRKGMLHRTRLVSHTSDNDESVEYMEYGALPAGAPYVHLQRNYRPNVFYIYSGRYGTPIV